MRPVLRGFLEEIEGTLQKEARSRWKRELNVPTTPDEGHWSIARVENPNNPGETRAIDVDRGTHSKYSKYPKHWLSGEDPERSLGLSQEYHTIEGPPQDPRLLATYDKHRRAAWSSDGSPALTYRTIQEPKPATEEQLRRSRMWGTADKHKELGLPVYAHGNDVQREPAPGSKYLQATTDFLRQHPQGAQLSAMEGQQQVARAMQAEQEAKQREALGNFARKMQGNLESGGLDEQLSRVRNVATAAPLALGGLALGHHMLSEKYKDHPVVQGFNQSFIPGVTGALSGAGMGGLYGALKNKSIAKSVAIGALLGGGEGIAEDQLRRAMNKGVMLDKSPEQIREHIAKRESMPGVIGASNAVMGAMAGGMLGSIGREVGGHHLLPAAGALAGGALAGSLGYRYGQTTHDELKAHAKRLGVDVDMPAETKVAAGGLTHHGALRRGVFRDIATAVSGGLREANPQSRIPGIVDRIGSALEGVHLSPELAQMEPEKLTRLQRARQVLLGYRPEALRAKYEAAAPGPEKEELLRMLSKEDTNTGMARMAVGASALPAAGAVSYGGYKGYKALVPNSSTPMEVEQGDTGASPEEIERRRALLSPAERAAVSLGERFNTRKGDTDKVTGQDVGDAVRGTAAAGALTKYTGNSALSRLLGVQTAYHGTTAEAAKKILETGIDPSYGGAEGGATQRLTSQGNVAEALRGNRPMRREDLNRLNPAMAAEALDAHLANGPRSGAAADRIQPTLPLMTHDEPIPVDTTHFLDNARNRSYVAVGEAGRSAAGAYASIQDPLVEQRLRADAQMRGAQAAKDGDASGRIRAMYDTLMAGSHARDELTSREPGKGKVVGMAMPMEQFEKNFELDKDDVTKFQTGYKTRLDEHGHPMPIIGKEHLNLGDVTTGNIVRNRSKDMMGYIKKHPGRFAAGVAGTGLNVAAHGYNLAHNIIPTAAKLIPDAVKNKVRAMMPTIASPETAAAPEQ